MALEKFNLEGKVALVTGGSRGMGRAIALGLAEAGADVVVVARKLPALEEVAREITRRGRRCFAISAHVGRKEDRERLITQAKEEFGRLDILVNNAGTSPFYGSVFEVTEEGWDKMMELNLKSCFFLSMGVARLMQEQGGGSIINMASATGIRPHPKLGAYSISKAGVIVLTRVLARELGQYHIRVNALAPGWVQTGFSRAVWENPEELDAVLAHTPLRRLAQPEDVVGAALLLASDASRHITGATVVIDGGYFF